jgi:RHS repeat-associated protein
MAKSAAMVAAGKASSFSRPARRAKAQPAERIPVCVPSLRPFVEGPGPGKAWWEKALSEKSFSSRKVQKGQQNQGVGAKSRTTNLGPFGEVIRSTGPMAKANPFRFSTIYQDDESDLLMYPYRPYSPSTGRFLSRDPIEEVAFKRNVLSHVLSIETGIQAKKANAFESKDYLSYVFVGNDPLDTIDLLGLTPCQACGRSVDQALRLTHTDVVNRFNALGFWGQCKACAPIWFPIGDYSMAWDMRAMVWGGWSKNMRCGKVTTCEWTVTVGGKCYNAWDVNYMLYGWAASMCGMTLDNMQAHVIAWKTAKKDWARLPGAMAFSTLGYFGVYSPLPPEVAPVGYPSCTACPLTYSAQLDSKWP